MEDVASAAPPGEPSTRLGADRPEPRQWTVGGRPSTEPKRHRRAQITLYAGSWDVALGIYRRDHPKASARMELTADGAEELGEALLHAADLARRNQAEAA